MRRGLLLVLMLLALASPARAQMVFSGVAPACAPPTAPGSVITPSSPACTLVDQNANVFNFTGAASGSNFVLDVNSQFLSGALEAHRCADGFVSWNKIVDAVTPTTLFVEQNNASGIHVQGSTFCNLSLGNFVDTTAVVNYNTAQAATDNAPAGHTLHFLAMPVGIPFWNSGFATGGNGPQANMTINVDSGADFRATLATEPPGQALVVINGASTTLNGGIYRHVGSGPGDDVSAIHIDTNASTPVVENVSLDSVYGTCLLAGGNQGAATLTDIVAHNCGLNNNSTGGQNHNIYLSEQVPASPFSDWTITGIDSYDVTGGVGSVNGNGGWTLKLRAAHNVTVTGDAAHYYIGCQAGTAPQCEQNGAIDVPCGGNVNISHLVIEIGPGGDNWFMIREGEETPGGPPNCPTLGTYADTITVDTAIFIWDNNSAPGLPAFSTIPIICSGNSACLLSGSFTACIKNSIIISNPNAPHPLGLGPGVTDCGVGGNSNTFYASRTAAATAKGWSGADKFGNPCCAFPWVPPKP